MVYLCLSWCVMCVFSPLQRLCEVVCGPDVVETLSLLCSGARVHTGVASVASPLARAERMGQALQTELLRHNEYTGTHTHTHTH